MPFFVYFFYVAKFIHFVSHTKIDLVVKTMLLNYTVYYVSYYVTIKKRFLIQKWGYQNRFKESYCYLSSTNILLILTIISELISIRHTSGEKQEMFCCFISPLSRFLQGMLHHLHYSSLLSKRAWICNRIHYLNCKFKFPNNCVIKNQLIKSNQIYQSKN